MKKMRGNCFCVTLLSLALFQGNMFWWGNRAVYRVPNLGDEMPCEPQAQYRLLISSAETAPSCLAWFNGVAFEVAGAQGSKVIYVAIDDPRYRTPEGIHPGSRLNE